MSVYHAQDSRKRGGAVVGEAVGHGLCGDVVPALPSRHGGAAVRIDRVLAVRAPPPHPARPVVGMRALPGR
jgi:hypothetical protein